MNTDTARISLHGGRGAVPGWFWGLLGCLTVLGVGLAGLFAVVKFLPASGAAAAVRAAGVPTGARGAGIQVEQLASPPPPALAPLPAARPRLPPRAVKVARSPGAVRPSSDTAAAAENDQETETAAPAARAGAAAADDSADSEADKPAKPKDKADSDDTPRARRATAAAARERRERAKPPADDDDDDK